MFHLRKQIIATQNWFFHIKSFFFWEISRKFTFAFNSWCDFFVQLMTYAIIFWWIIKCFFFTKSVFEKFTEACNARDFATVNDPISWKSENLLSFFRWLLKCFIGVASRTLPSLCVFCVYFSLRRFFRLSLNKFSGKQRDLLSPRR